MKVAVTGASGFIGALLCTELRRAGHEVVGLAGQSSFPFGDEQFQVHRGNILEPSNLDKLCAGAQVIFHVAGKISVDGDPDGSVWRTNVDGTRQVVDACLRNGVQRLVYFSSIHSMCSPAQKVEFNESAAPAKSSFGAYGHSKVMAEFEVQKGAKKGLETIVLNPTAVVGPQDHRPSATGQALLDMLDKKFPVLIKGGYDFVDVRDVVQTAINAMTMGRSGERYILSGEYLSVARMAGLVEKYSCVKQPNIFLPNWVQWVGLPFIKAMAKLSGNSPLYTAEMIRTTAQGQNISSKKAERELGHAPRPMEESIKDTIDFLVSS